jgi:hypothetical protein
LDIDVSVEKRIIAKDEFKKDVSQSNRIWIGERTLEDWLDAKVGKSECCNVCGNEECRTVEVEGESHETIPADLIMKAGLLAASQLVTDNKESC